METRRQGDAEKGVMGEVSEIGKVGKTGKG